MSSSNPSRRSLRRSNLTLLLLIAAASITASGCQNWWKPGKNKSLLGFVREQPEESPEVAPPVASTGPAKRVVLPRDRERQEPSSPSSNHLTRSELAALPTPKDNPPAESANPVTPVALNSLNATEKQSPNEIRVATEKPANIQKSATSDKANPNQNTNNANAKADVSTATNPSTDRDMTESATNSKTNTSNASDASGKSTTAVNALPSPPPALPTSSTTTPPQKTSEVDLEEALALLPPAYQSKMRQAIDRQTPGLVSLENKSTNETASTTNPVGTNLVEPASFRDQKERSTAANDPNRWTEDLNRTIQSLEQRLAQSPTLDPSLRAHLEMNLRLLYLTQRDLEKAKRPIEGLSSREQSFLDHQLTAWFQTTSPDPNPNRPRHWSQVITEQQQANRHLAALGALQINCIEFCSQVDGYGAIHKFPKKLFQPDQELLLYCELENVTAETVRNGFETRIKGTYELRDAQGKRVLEQTLPMEPDICEHQRRDHFLVYKIFMPASIPNGKYELQLTMEDLHGNKFAVSKTEFEIRK